MYWISGCKHLGHAAQASRVAKHFVQRNVGLRVRQGGTGRWAGQGEWECCRLSWPTVSGWLPARWRPGASSAPALTLMMTSSPSCSLPMMMPLRRLTSPMMLPWNSEGAVICACEGHGGGVRLGGGGRGGAIGGWGGVGLGRYARWGDS